MGFTKCTVAIVCDDGATYRAEFPVSERMVYEFFVNDDPTLIRAAKGLLGVSGHTRNFVFVDRVVDYKTGKIYVDDGFTVEDFNQIVDDVARALILDNIMEAS